MEEERKPSEVLQEFADWIRHISDEYDACKAIIAEEDAKKQDFLHALEFSLDCRERSKIATIVHNSRERRRKAKNQMELLEGIVTFFRKEQTKAFVRTAKVMVTNQKVVEARLGGDRTYIPRTSALKDMWGDICPSAVPEEGGDEIK